MQRVLLFLWLLANPAFACPTPHGSGQVVETVSGADLASGVVAFTVVAGGDRYLPDCGFRPRGFTTTHPDFELRLGGIAGARVLTVEARAGCDTLLLMMDAVGNWHFDDDSGAGLSPLLRVARPANGTYRLWVGTFGNYSCRSTLRLYTE